MKKAIPIVLIALWLPGFSAAFAMPWLRTPWRWFINLPDSVWNFLIGRTDDGCESIADLETTVGLGLGVRLGGLIALAFFPIRRRLKPAGLGPHDTFVKR